MSRVRVGVIGAGQWGAIHAEVFATSEHAELAGICDVDLERAEALARKFGVRAFGNYEELVSDPAVDAVSVATPDHLHREPVVAAARASKPILVEKPLATTSEDLAAIEEAVNSSGVPLMVDFHARWNPPLVLAADQIQEGTLGSLVSMYYRLNDTISVPTSLLSWSTHSSILWFLGSHSVDTLRWLSGSEVVRVFAVSRRGLLESMGYPVEDAYQTTLEFANGTIAQIENNWVIPNTNPNVNDIKLNVTGTKGMINMDLTNNQMFELYLEDRAEHPDILVKPRMRGELRGFAIEAIRDFAGRLVAGKPFLATMKDGIAATRTVLAIMDSARTRKPVEIKIRGER